MAKLLGRVGAAWRRAREALLEHAYLVTLGAVVTIIAATAMYTSRLRACEEAGVQAAAQAEELRETASPTPEVTPLPTIAPLVAHTSAVMLGGSTVWPVSGKVVRGHDTQTSVLWEALSCWKVHTGLDVSGEAGEDVLAVMDGVVSAVTMDALWGWSVLVEQTDGSLATYVGLSCAEVTQGQSVTRGCVLGLLGEIPCEAELGPHLHYALTVDGATQDPSPLLERASRP